MATLDEIWDLSVNRQYEGLGQKVAAAVVKKAQVIADSATPTAEEKAWAREALANPKSVAASVFPYVIAANSAASVAVILAANDTTIQTNVDAAVDNLFGVS